MRKERERERKRKMAQQNKRMMRVLYYISRQDAITPFDESTRLLLLHSTSCCTHDR